MDTSTDVTARQLCLEVEQRGLGAAEWKQQVAQLEEQVDVTALAVHHRSFVRRRAIRSAHDLLRMVLVYAACDWSLQEVAMWSTVLGLGSYSKVALRQRLRRCSPWLTELVGALLRVPRAPQTGVRVRLMDTTTVTAPGTRGTSWRLHVAWDLGTLQMTDVTLTPTGEDDAETLGRFPLSEGEIVIADQGFSYAASLEPLLQGRFPCVVRCNWRSIRLEDEAGNRVEVVTLMRSLPPRQMIERPVWVCHEGARYPMRMIIGALPTAQAARARQRVRARLRKRGRTPTAATLVTAGHTLLLSNLPLVAWSGVRILELYRWRWHIEMYFKRLKSILQLDHLRARDRELARVYLLAKLLIALLVDGQIRSVQRAHPDWFQSLSRPVSPAALTGLYFSGLRQLLVGPFTPYHINMALPRLARFLRDSPRRRASLLIQALYRLSCFPPVTYTWMAPT